jgi:hypothetical protein
MGQFDTIAGAPMQDNTTSSSGDAIINTSTIPRRINRNYISSQNISVAQEKAQSSVIENDIANLDAQLNSLMTQMSDTANLRDTQKNIYDTLSAQISESDSKAQSNPRKMTANQRLVAVQNRDKAYQAYQQYSANLLSMGKDKDRLLLQRNALADKLTAMGRPVSRRANLNIEGKPSGIISQIVENVAENVKENIGSGSGMFRPTDEQLEYMMGKPDGNQDGNQDGTIQQPTQINPIITYVAIGLGALVIYKLFLK